MAVSETSERADAPAGLWKHKITGETAIAIETAKFGNPQGNAYARLGFEYQGPLSAKEIEALKKDSTNALKDPTANEDDPTAVTSLKSVADLKAELAAAEAREKSYADQREEAEKERKEADKEAKAEESTVVVPEQKVNVKK